MEKVEGSTLWSNANNRLLSELSKLLLLSNTMGWTLEYGDHRIDSLEKLLDLHGCLVN